MKKYRGFFAFSEPPPRGPPGAGGEGLDLDVSQMQVHVCACADCKYRDLDEILAQVQRPPLKFTRKSS